MHILTNQNSGLGTPSWMLAFVFVCMLVHVQFVCIDIYAFYVHELCEI